MEKQQVIRNKIIELGLLLFAEKGLAGTSVDTVIKTLGIGKSQFYGQFRSKAELIEELIKIQFEDRVLYNPPAIRTFEQLQRWFAAIIEETKAPLYKHGCPVINLAGQVPGTDQALIKVVHEAFSSWENELAQILVGLRKTGHLDTEISESALAAQVRSAILGAFTRNKILGSKVPLEETFAGLLALMRPRTNFGEKKELRGGFVAFPTQKREPAKPLVRGFCP